MILFVYHTHIDFLNLAETTMNNADQVKNAIENMITQIVNNTPYGDVLQEPLRLHNPKTFLVLVKDLASVSFCDCSVDSKGAAFEYYVRATLKGKETWAIFYTTRGCTINDISCR